MTQTSKEIVQEQAKKLGGGWRVEQGIMPVVVLTTVEASKIIEKLERTIGGTNQHEYMIIDAEYYNENFSGALLLGWRVIADLKSWGGLLLERKTEGV